MRIFPYHLAIVGACALMALGGCSVLSDIFPSMANKVAALESGYTATAGLEAAYLDPKVPFCNGNGIKICKTVSGVQSVLAADNTAFLAIKAARTAEDETTYTAAQSALTAFQGVTNGLPTTTPATN